MIEYSSKRQKVLPFNELSGFIDSILNDEEYYVQKGIGWTLRKIYNVYPKETLAYLNKNLLRINSVAYPAATKKIDKFIKK